MAHKHAVFPAQWRQVADDAHGNEIEVIAQIGFASPGDLLYRVAKFEDESSRAEVGVPAESLGVDHGGALGRLLFWFVVVDDDQIDTLLREPRCLVAR